GIRDFPVTGVQTSALPILFAGACKACPWGVLAFVTQAALKNYGYDVKVCWVCWGGFGPRQMADKTKPTMPQLPPDAVEIPYIEQIGRASCRERVGIVLGAY